MAKSKESFNKRAKEQKRLKQRQDKQERMEERKLTTKKGKGLEEMLAYVDENGNITDTPPDPKQRKDIKAEDIQIGIPPGNERETTRTGRLQFFNEEKGFGFIIDDLNQERIFLHSSNLHTPVQLNDRLRYDLQTGDRGYIAINVSKLDK
ncbi:MAG TPA: cold shock domain-containing protein [Chitinophagaceae bacterium]|jgi:cold shock CspA family protein|nr:cold shock domain-containing protein [Chitinophagaceae bacterium]